MGPLQTRLASALKLARDVAAREADEIRDIYGKVSEAETEDAARAALEPHALVFDALREAMATLKGLPDPEAGWLYSQGFWPAIVHDHEEQIENYKEMLRRISSGEESVDALMGRKAPSSAAIDRMEVIFEVFPKCLTGKTKARDWKILCFLASGHTMKIVGRMTGVSPQTVSDRKDVQCRQIAMRLAELMPAPVSPRTLAPPRAPALADRPAA